MRFNKAIDSISVLSFDLDDTLYNNHPVIKAAVQAQLDYLNQITQWSQQGPNYWSHCRNQTVKQTPSLANDVTRWRKVALQYGMSKLPLTEEQAHHYASCAYQAFSDARSNITVQQSVLDLLGALRTKFRLIAITNGNVEINKFNLRNEFELVLKAGPDGAAKPHSELFDKAAVVLNVKKSEILHIGDSLDSDVQGANLAGCNSLWLNNQQFKYKYLGLSHIEINNINDLYQLVNTSPSK
ncbi:HAD-IA family hydrolase [Pseudoalteromonas sp. MMG005]|uniref:HAD-IA family hydrolase n=1 Tax=Pseudoalteromonas sp. MMG005 TaxID=2822682 RepID=UPI001B3A1A8B|nr:HAD-IA family hydrolase [Pseudoalteromonas sp. MMG005]MBQ4847821.1 HAD-IA family hydrolase [Pseudoalteromonas sp. MMG005]